MACISLLSDFGLQDASVAIAKGILMQHAPLLPIIDISHEVQPFNGDQAAYLLAAAYKNFPAGTCHVVLFDLFAGTTNRIVLSEYEGHYFLSADNTLVATALGAQPANTWLCPEFDREAYLSNWLHAAGHTIQSLQLQDAASLGLAPYKLPGTDATLALNDTGTLKCEVIHVDHYENVVINVTRKQLEQWSNGRSFRLQFSGMEEITELSTHYNTVRDGYKLCRFNSNDYLEICINRGKAASLFGLRLGGKLNDIKILFE